MTLRHELTVVAIFLASCAIQATALAPIKRIKAQTETPADNLFAMASAQLNETASALGDVVKGKGDPTHTPLGIVANDLAPFWTAGQIGSLRAAKELGAEVIFTAPIKPGDAAAQSNIIGNFIKEGYKGIAFSAIDPDSIQPIIQQGIAQNVHFTTLDSDAPQTGRLIYIGTNNYNAGVAAARALFQVLGNGGGKVVGLVGALTAQNASDRVRGIRDTIKGTNVSLETVMVDDLDPLKAENDAAQALVQYPDLAAFVALYSYDGAAVGNALRLANKIGVVKVVAFDLEPETISFLKDGTISAAVGQRPYFMGYLSVYTLYAISTIGPESTLKVLDPYLTGDNKDVIDTGVDIVTPQTLPEYSNYLNSIGIKSQ